MSTGKQSYTNSISIFIYKIICNSENVKDIYIGQTENFEIRKNQHERDSKISHLKVYDCIRDNGGWVNWNMIKLNKHECKDKYEARQIEQKYMDLFTALFLKMGHLISNVK